MVNSKIYAIYFLIVKPKMFFIISSVSNNMIIKNIYVYGDQNNNEKKLCNIRISQNGSLEILPADLKLDENQSEPIFDAKTGYTLMPGLFDTHVHGQGGGDFADVGLNPELLFTITESLGQTGLSYVMATLVSLELPTLKKCLAAIDSFMVQQEKNPLPGSAKIVGIHLEGPFIAKSCKGAHAEHALQSTISMEKLKDIISAAPHVKQWKITLAPELEGAQDFLDQIKNLEQEGIFVHVSIGHANPDKKIITAAINTGKVKSVTHLPNACGELCSRVESKMKEEDVTSNLSQWVLANVKECPYIEMILDGQHVYESYFSLINNKLQNKIILVTDNLGPSGLSDGLYKLGTLFIRKEANNFYLADEKGNFLFKESILPNGEKGKVKILAGSAAPLSFCAKKFAEWAHLHEKENGMDVLFKVLVNNPRVSALSNEAIMHLPDKQNFVIFDDQYQLVLSACQGKIMQHRDDFVKKKNRLTKDSFFNADNIVIPEQGDQNKKPLSF